MIESGRSVFVPVVDDIVRVISGETYTQIYQMKICLLITRLSHAHKDNTRRSRNVLFAKTAPNVRRSS